MRKVTTPSRKEVQATTAVVIVTVFLFGVYFFVIDYVIGQGVDRLFRTFSK
jgi:preprotein translocase subunit SecE